MVEINFMEVYCQPTKNIFKVTISQEKYEESKRTMSDIHPRTFYLGSGVVRGENKLGQTVLDASLRGRSTHFAVFKTCF